MNLPVTGQPLHTRSLTVVVTTDEGGLWRTHGNVIDIRKTGFAPMPTGIQPAGLIHSMSIDLRVHPESLRIESLETRQPRVAVEPSRHTNGDCCRDPASNLNALVGESLDSGFRKRLSLVFGGPRGCSHLLALFSFMAAAVSRAAAFEKKRASGREGDRPIGECLFQRSLSIDGMQNEHGDVELSAQIGDYHLGPEQTVGLPLERLDLEHDVRLYGRVGFTDQVLGEFRAAERRRDHDSLATAQWHERPEWGQSLVGTPLLSGFAGRVLDICGPEPEQHLLTDALLQLAPGHYQVLAAFADQWSIGAETPGGGEPSGAAGAMTANCYMWRPGGGLGPL